MSLEMGEYPHKEVYYFLPLVRKIYALMLQHEVPEQYTPSLIRNIKELSQYYAHAFLTNDIIFTQEDHLMTSFMSNLDTALNGNLRGRLASVHEAQTYKTDGDIDRFVYGSVGAEAFAKQPIADNRPTYHTSHHGGLLCLNPTEAHNVLSHLSTYICTERQDAPIELWGNVAHGIVDAAGIYEYLQLNNIPSTLHLCRYSPHAFHDSQTHTIGESCASNAWHIAVDSLVSDQGTTASQLLTFLNGAKRSSVWTTWNGLHYCERHQGIVTSTFAASQDTGCGVLIEPI